MLVTVPPRFKFMSLLCQYGWHAVRKKQLYEKSRKGKHLSVVAFDNISFQTKHHI